MPKCNTCGTANADGAGYCGVCGAMLPTSKAAKGMVHRLRVVPAGGAKGRLFELPAGKWVCGRNLDCKIVLADPFVSPKHALLTAGANLILGDLNSTNGTYLRLRAPLELRAGDELRMGMECLRLETLPIPATAAGGGSVWGSASQGHRFRLLQLLAGGGSGETLALGDGDHVIGREEGAMTFPDDLSMSGRHAVITVQGETATLRDLGSSNGTFVRLRGERELQFGDQLVIGHQQLRYTEA